MVGDRVNIRHTCIVNAVQALTMQVFFDFSLTVKAAPYECVIRTGQHET